jgi:hypothetical protein
LKGTEQNLKLSPRVVSQLTAGDDLRHQNLLFVAKPRRSGPFLRPGSHHRQGKACRTAALSDQNWRQEEGIPAGAAIPHSGRVNRSGPRPLKRLGGIRQFGSSPSKGFRFRNSYAF